MSNLIYFKLTQNKKLCEKYFKHEKNLLKHPKYGQQYTLFELLIFENEGIYDTYLYDPRNHKEYDNDEEMLTFFDKVFKSYHSDKLQNQRRELYNKIINFFEEHRIHNSYVYYSATKVKNSLLKPKEINSKDEDD
jgi:hypothetical protein